MNQLTPMKGNVTAIVPQSIEDVFRVAKGVVMSGLAPDALVKGKDGDEAVAAIAIAIMSGAELGLKPMVALRSFTVINGKPALYGDGLINVIRQSGRAERLATGHTKGNLRILERAGRLPNPDDYPAEDREAIRAENLEAFNAMPADEKECGWCEADRADTHENKTVVFSVSDAKRAGLWQTDGNTPWAKYPQRMLAWRAAGWCLRELFGDVLGGIRDEFEAQEVQEHEPQAVIAPPPPETVEEPQEEFAEADVFDLEAFLAKVTDEIAVGNDEDTVIEIWDALDVEATLTDDEPALQRAFDIRAARLETIKANEADAALPVSRNRRDRRA